MSVRGKNDRGWVAAAKLRRDMGLRLGPDLAHDPVPFIVGETGRIVPAFDLPLVRGVGPEVVAVRREVEPVGRGGQALREERFETQSSVLSDQCSGKARVVRVEAR